MGHYFLDRRYFNTIHHYFTRILQKLVTFLLIFTTVNKIVIYVLKIYWRINLYFICIFHKTKMKLIQFSTFKQTNKKLCRGKSGLLKQTLVNGCFLWDKKNRYNNYRFFLVQCKCFLNRFSNKYILSCFTEFPLFMV